MKKEYVCVKCGFVFEDMLILSNDSILPQPECPFCNVELLDNEEFDEYMEQQVEFSIKK